MNYPVELSFKLLALGNQIRITDSTGSMIGFVKQKLFKLKEDIRIFADEGQTRELFSIKADRIIDFSASYSFYDSATGAHLGSVKRKGMRSIWKAHYLIFQGDQKVMEIQEENAWIKVVDALIGELPVIGMFTGYFFNPSYLVTRNDGTVMMRIDKQPAMFEGKFKLSEQADMDENEERLAFLAALTMTLLERIKG